MEQDNVFQLEASFSFTVVKHLSDVAVVPGGAFLFYFFTKMGRPPLWQELLLSFF